jgi:hypothetical protein
MRTSEHGIVNEMLQKGKLVAAPFVKFLAPRHAKFADLLTLFA